jgi:hypothetical protein
MFAAHLIWQSKTCPSLQLFSVVLIVYPYSMLSATWILVFMELEGIL